MALTRKEERAAILYADSLDSRVLPKERSDKLMKVIEPAISEFKEIAALSVRELGRRVKEDSDEISTPVLVGIIDKMLALSERLEGGKGNISESASDMIRILKGKKNSNRDIYE